MTLSRLRTSLSNRRLTLTILLLLLFGAYLYNLTGWQVFDDEGEYLYQVWRMTLGELPYRDFLTPQLPVFLFAGSGLMSVVGDSLFAMRLYSIFLAFLTASLLYAAGRRHGNHWIGLLALLLFLGHQDVFREVRIFRNEPLFLFFVTAGLVVATWSRGAPKRSHLMAAGICFGLATMVKLFGLLPAGGVGLWLLWSWWRQQRPFSELVLEVVAFVAPIVLFLGLTVGGFTLLVPDFLDLVLGHHLAQGSQLALREVLLSKARLFSEYVAFYPVLVAAALISAALAVVKNTQQQRWALQLPTVLAFFVLSREFGPRHFMYLLPALCLLAAWLLFALLSGRYGRWSPLLGAVALALILIPAVSANTYRASWQDTETDKVVALIEERMAPGEFMLADDIGLAFYARRPTTYSGAALSHGAVTSGQITGEMLIDEIVRNNVRMVLVDTSLLTGNHMVFLRDYPRFHRFLENNYQRLSKLRRDYQEIEIWWRPADRPLVVEDRVTMQYRDGTRFGENMRLLGYSFDEAVVAPGQALNFTLYWYAEGPADNYWSVFAHLVGPDGSLVAQDDKVPYDGVYPPNRWWPGQIIDDKYTIPIPTDAPAGTYQIRLGMYDWQTGERLALTTAAGEPLPDNQVVLEQTVEVRP